MAKIVFIGAGGVFGARCIADFLSFPSLHDSELVLVDIDQHRLDIITAWARAASRQAGAAMRVTPALSWRDGVLEGADFVMTAFAAGKFDFTSRLHREEIGIPQEYGIYQNVADTAGIGGLFRTLRTAPEMVAIARDMERRCPDAFLISHVNPMAALTRIVRKSVPRVQMLGLCHNIQFSIRWAAQWLGLPSHRDLRYVAAGINHMDWFLRLEYLDGRDAYPDLVEAMRDAEIYQKYSVHAELLKHFGHLTTETNHHISEYLPYYMPREKDRDSVLLTVKEVDRGAPLEDPKTNLLERLAAEASGIQPLNLERSIEYSAPIMNAVVTDTPTRMHLNVLNNGLIDNLPNDYCVEVPCTFDRMGVHPHKVGNLPVQLAALCRGMADMQTLASDAYLEKDVEKACYACLVDPLTAGSAAPGAIRECFTRLLLIEREALDSYMKPEIDAWLSAQKRRFPD